MPPFLCLASRLKGCSVTLKDAGSAASEPWLTALHPPPWGLPLGILGSPCPTRPGEGAVTAMELRGQRVGQHQDALPCWGGRCLQDGRTACSSDPRAGGGAAPPVPTRWGPA